MGKAAKKLTIIAQLPQFMSATKYVGNQQFKVDFGMTECDANDVKEQINGKHRCSVQRSSLQQNADCHQIHWHYLLGSWLTGVASRLGFAFTNI